LADLLGPSGQPISSNPFTQSQGMKADVSLSTGSAERTMADLTNVLEKAAKSFGVAFNATTKDTLAGQERFYRYIGDKENERRTSLERYKRAAIDSVNEETKFAIASYEEKARAAKRSQEEINKGKIDLAKKADSQIKSITQEAEKRSQGPGLFGKALEGVQGFGNKIGGPIGGMISGAASLAADPYVAIPAAIIGAILKVLGTESAFVKPGAALRGAGLTGGSASELGLGFNERVFAGLGVGTLLGSGGILSQEEKIKIIGTMAGSRSMIDQTKGPGGVEALTKNMGLFGNILPDVAAQMEIFTSATKDLGMSQSGISNLYHTSALGAKALNITQMDAIKTQMTMTQALRNITNDGTVAAITMSRMSEVLKATGASEAERQKYLVGFAGAAASLPLDKIAGLFAYTHGGKMPTMTELYGTNGKGGMLGTEGSGVFGLMGSFISKVGGQFQDPVQRLFAASKLNAELGLGISTRDMGQFFNITEQFQGGKIGDKEYKEGLAKLQAESGKTVQEGLADLAKAVTPMTTLTNWFESIIQSLGSIDSSLRRVSLRGGKSTDDGKGPKANIDKSLNYGVEMLGGGY